MRILVLGQGAREHALIDKLSQSSLVTHIYCVPGSDAIGRACTVDSKVDANNAAAVVFHAQKNKIDLVVVGPEKPLENGVADALIAEKILVFGPTRAAAQIETSKIFSKMLMAEAGIPTAAFEVADHYSQAESVAKTFFQKFGSAVIKADGLFAGKGVCVANSFSEIENFISSLSKVAPQMRFVIEQALTGPEVSMMAFCDGSRFAALPLSQDYKRLFDGQKGPNTGGMGAFAPSTLLDAAQADRVAEIAIGKALQKLRERGTRFVGALYAGLMLTPKGPFVLEYNARLGDPETQVLMSQIDEDIVPLMLQCAKGALVQTKVKERSGASVGVVLASRGYPESPELGHEIRNVDLPLDTNERIFHAGTVFENHKWKTKGGRVLTACAHADSLEAAREKAYRLAEKVQFEGKHVRRDVGR